MRKSPNLLLGYSDEAAVVVVKVVVAVGITVVVEPADQPKPRN